MGRGGHKKVAKKADQKAYINLAVNKLQSDLRVDDLEALIKERDKRIVELEALLVIQTLEIRKGGR